MRLEIEEEKFSVLKTLQMKLKKKREKGRKIKQN